MFEEMVVDFEDDFFHFVLDFLDGLVLVLGLRLF